MNAAAKAASRAGFSWLAPVLVAALAFAAYAPVVRNGFIFDDDLHVTANALTGERGGYGQIWTSAELFHYYPMTFSAFRLQRSLWGLDPRGYHLFNVLLHALAALLLGRTLLRLGVKEPWWAAALFAVHPVHVETVAWISELKNLLCLLFALAATERWLAFGESGRKRDYALSFLLFWGSLLSKTIGCLLPFVLLTLDWRAGKKLDRRYFERLAPLVLLGGVMSVVTVYFEWRVIGLDADFAVSWPQRPLLIGKIFWFYVLNLLWPAKLSFMYERAPLDAARLAQWLPFLAAAALCAAAWLRRNALGRWPAAALACYLLLLFPASGVFVNFSMRFSYVFDHYVYLASVPVLALLPAAAALALKNAAARRAVLAAAVLACAASTWARVPAFESSESLWRDAARKTPTAWMAWHNLAEEELARGRWEQAADHARRAVTLMPALGIAWYQLGVALWNAGDHAGAAAAFTRSLSVGARHLADTAPRRMLAHTHIAIQALESGDKTAAVDHFRQAAHITPENAASWLNLGRALIAQGRKKEAVVACRRGLALAHDPAAAVPCRALLSR